MQKPQPEIAFIAAAMALLVLPLLVMFGVMLLGLGAALMVQMDRLTYGHGTWMLLALFMGWVLLVVAAVLALISRLLRNTTRS